MEGSSRRNVAEKDTPVRGGAPMIQLTRDELQRMMEEESRNAIVAYERRATTPMVKDTIKRQLFGGRDVQRLSGEASRREYGRSRGPIPSEAGSSSQVRAKAREPVISRAEVESVGKQIELLGKQIDELKRRGELVTHNKNSPFCNNILTQVVEFGFRMPDLQKYDGTRDTHEHVAAFELVMNLNGQSSSIMAKLFVTTLTATHLFNIRQREDESLKNFMGRFNNEKLEVQDLRIDMMVSILIHGLKKGPFTSALARDPPGDVEQLMALAQKYIDKKEMNAMKDMERRKRDQAFRRPSALVKVAIRALMIVENADVLKWPRHTRQGYFWDRVPSGCKTRRDETRRSRSRSRDRNPGPARTDKAPVDRSNAPTKGVIYTIAGVHKVLIDSESSTDIIFKTVIDKMGLDNARLEPVKTPLMGFGGSKVVSLGMIELPVSMGDEPRCRTMIVKFLVVENPFTYNVILGKPRLNSFRAVVSTYDMKIKFPTDNGVGEVSCDRKEARKCYNLAVKGGSEQKKRKVVENPEPRPYEANHMKPSEEHKAVELVEGDLSKTTRIRTWMGGLETIMIDFL
ncbi:UNVERIFIED_CONTAM: hypothetical protein Sindi_2692100 [Sesamum indicum]